jgi:hypothetical protein
MSEYFYLNYKITQKDKWPIENNILLFCDSEDEAHHFIYEEGGHYEKQLLQERGLTDSEAIFEWGEVFPVREENEDYEETL